MNIESAIINCERGHPLSIEDCLEVLFRLQAAESKLEEMANNKDEPIFWYRPVSSGGYEGPIHNNVIEEVRKKSGVWKGLFPHPPVQSNADKEIALEILNRVEIASGQFNNTEMWDEEVDIEGKTTTFNDWIREPLNSIAK